MSPSRHLPKTPVPIGEGQGGLLEASTETSGGTDPGQRSTHVTFTEHPEGIFEQPKQADETVKTPGTPEMAEPGISVDLETRSRALANALGNVAAATGRNGLIKAIRTAPRRRREIEKRYGKEHVAGLLEGTDYYAKEDLEDAQAEFEKAFGGKQMVEASLRKPEDSKRETTAYLKRFFDTYYGAENRKVRDHDRKNIEQLPEVVKGSRKPTKHRKPSEPKDEIVFDFPFAPTYKPDEKGQKLSKRERLIVPEIADKAGFLPKTKREATVVLALLSHIKDPNGSGVHNHLKETYDRQIKVFSSKQKVDAEGSPLFDDQNQPVMYSYPEALERAEDAERSRVMEIVDFYTNSYQQTVILQQALEFIKGCPNPAATLAEELEEYNIDPRNFYSLVRFAHDKEVRNKGSIALEYDPFKPHENRTGQRAANKNKTVEDPYTAEELDPKVLQEVNRWLSTTTIKQARIIAPEAVMDEQRRERFWRHVYRNLRGRDKEVARQAVAETIKLAG